MTGDLLFGRLLLPSIEDPITEMIGSDVTATGDATAVGERKAKGFTMNFIVHAFEDTTPTATGNRLRRQLRSLIQNPAYRLAGVYMNFAPDLERNGWLVVGSGELQDDDGGVTFGSYKLILSQAFLVAALRTHREGYRVDLTDRRLTDSPIDYAGEVINTAAWFAGLTALALTALPAGASDADVLGSPVTAGARSGVDGTCAVCAARSTGDVISWERPEANFNQGDVVVYDRRGSVVIPV